MEWRSSLGVGLALLMVTASCTDGAGDEPTGASSSPATVTTTSTMVSTTLAEPSSTTTTAPAPPTTAIPPRFEILLAGDYADQTVPGALNDWFSRGDGFVEATIVCIDGWCCENPPFVVADVEVLQGRRGFELDDGQVHGREYQDLEGRVNEGDRVTMLVGRDGIVSLVFDEAGEIVHPISQGAVDAIGLLGEGIREMTPLELIRLYARWYHNDWWPDDIAAVFLQGVPGHEDTATCSAADLTYAVGDDAYSPAAEGLSAAAAQTRALLIGAAVRCDYDTLVATSRAGDDTYWWSGHLTPAGLREIDRRGGALRQLTYALLGTPMALSDSGEYYAWPSLFLTADLPLDADWQDQITTEELERAAGLNGISVEALIEAIEVFGGYALFRVVIGVDGSWLAALSGD